MPAPAVHCLLTLDYFTTSRNCLHGYNLTVNSEICKLSRSRILVRNYAIELGGIAREMGGKNRGEMCGTPQITHFLGLSPGV
jgi:hypothetical protein